MDGLGDPRGPSNPRWLKPSLLASMMLSGPRNIDEDFQLCFVLERESNLLIMNSHWNGGLIFIVMSGNLRLLCLRKFLKYSKEQIYFSTQACLTPKSTLCLVTVMAPESHLWSV